MSTEDVNKFQKFFQNFIELCQLDNWPNKDTRLEEIREAFIRSQHVQKCINKFEKKKNFDTFMSLLENKQNASLLFLKSCLSDPPKYIFKKIFTSSANIDRVDESFIMFIEIFSKEELESCLSDIMIEVASKDFLFKNMSREFSKSSLLNFSSHLFLANLCQDEDSIQAINIMLTKDCTQDSVDLLVNCLLNKNLQYESTVKAVAQEFLNAMKLDNNDTNKKLWQSLFCTEQEKFVEMCLIHDNILELILKALIDGHKDIINKSVSHSNCQFTYSELSWNIQKICRNEHLKSKFKEFLSNSNENMEFWEKELQL